jgi:hypothetical protein
MFGPIPGAVLFAATGNCLLNPDLSDPILYVLPTFFMITVIVTWTVGWLRRLRCGRWGGTAVGNANCTLTD